MRMMKLMRGGKRAQREGQLMVSKRWVLRSKLLQA
jgi:hypothetical protein